MPALDAHCSPSGGPRSGGDRNLQLAGRAIPRAQPTKPQSQRRGRTSRPPGTPGDTAEAREAQLAELAAPGEGRPGSGRWAGLRDGLSEFSGKAPLGPTAPLPPAGGRGENRIFRSWQRKPGRRAVRATMAASGVVRPWRALPGRPWPNLRGDGLAAAGRVTGPNTLAYRRQQGAWSASGLRVANWAQGLGSSGAVPVRLGSQAEVAGDVPAHLLAPVVGDLGQPAASLLQARGRVQRRHSRCQERALGTWVLTRLKVWARAMAGGYRCRRCHQQGFREVGQPRRLLVELGHPGDRHRPSAGRPGSASPPSPGV